MCVDYYCAAELVGSLSCSCESYESSEETHKSTSIYKLLAGLTILRLSSARKQHGAYAQNCTIHMGIKSTYALCVRSGKFEKSVQALHLGIEQNTALHPRSFWNIWNYQLSSSCTQFTSQGKRSISI